MTKVPWVYLTMVSTVSSRIILLRYEKQNGDGRYHEYQVFWTQYIGAPSDPGHTPNNLYHVMYWHIKQTMVEGGRQPVDFMVNSRLVID